MFVFISPNGGMIRSEKGKVTGETGLVVKLTILEPEGNPK